MTELRDNLNMESKRYFENDLITWLVLDEQRIRKENQIWWEDRRSAIMGSVCVC